LSALGAINTEHLQKGIEVALDAKASKVRLEGITQLAKLDPKAATPMLVRAIDKGELTEQQATFEALGSVPGEGAEKALLDWLSKLDSGRAPSNVRVDIIAAAERSSSAKVAEALAGYNAKFTDEEALDAWLPALEGGNAARGRAIFIEKTETQCMRCHKVGQQGGSEVGPDLSDVGERLERRTILESVVFPNNVIAEGFENVIIKLSSGDEVAGRVIEDSAAALVLELDAAEMARLATSKNAHSIVDVIAEKTANERTQVSFAKSDIEDRFRDVSSMPMDLTEFLTLHELRDVVEFLATRK
jgi:quinoprotein glucose dehydrogenase